MKKTIFLTIVYAFVLPLQAGIAFAQTEPPPALPLYTPTDNPGPNLKGFQDLLTNDLFTGEMRFGVPIMLPPGRTGLTPELALTYSSFKKDFLSPYGYGWDLSTSSIFRTSERGVDAMYDRNDFAVRIAGGYNELALVDAPSGLYMGKLGNDFNQYFLEGNQWRVVDTQGTMASITVNISVARTFISKNRCLIIE